MRIVVTGHLGYIGSVLTPALRRAGHEVTGLDNDLYAGCGLGPPAPAIPAVGVDIRATTPDHFRGADAVVHLAGLSNDPLGEIAPTATHSINHLAATRVARAARAAGVGRFLFASTCSVYGVCADDIVDEHTAPAPVTSYARAKAAAEPEILALAAPGFSPLVLRFATLYGFGPMVRGDLVVNNLVGYAVTTGRVLLKSAGTSWRPLLHVADAADIIERVLTLPSDRTSGVVVNAGHDSGNHRVRDVAETVRTVVEGSRVEFAEGATADPRSYRVSFGALQSLLPGWTPAWDVALGARELADAYRRYGLTLALLEGGTLQRVARVRELRAAGRVDSSLARSGDAVGADA